MHRAMEASLADLVDRIVRESGLEDSLKKSRTEEDQQRLANLGELVSAAADFIMPPGDDVPDADGDTDDEDVASAEDLSGIPLARQLTAFLESIALVSDADAIDPAKGAVTLMTLHAAKGLEFDVVAMAGLEDGLLPHSRATTSESELEEERRLCFVGITRAKRYLLITNAAIRTLRGMRERTIPSLFLNELPDDGVERSDQAGMDFDDEDTFESWGAGRPPRGADREFPVGCLVEHPTFGLGRVEAIMRRPAGSSARVVFAEGGTKTLILEYAKLRRVK
jgi:DNA helicase-2/ATP-dependent DNA helicase PcrA